MGKSLYLFESLILWVMVIGLTQMKGCKSCVDMERKGLLEIKAFLFPNASPLTTILRDWTNETESDCCRWERVKCDLTSGRVIGLTLNDSVSDSENRYPLFNLSLLYPFEELQSLNLSNANFAGLFDSVEGYGSFGRLRKLEVLNLSSNRFNNSILPFLNATASLKTLILHGNLMGGPFPFKGFAKLNRLEALDLSSNNFSGSLEMQGVCEMRNLLELDLSENKFEGQPPQCFSRLTKLKVLDLSSNQLSGKFPSSINSLRSLEYLSLSDNNFEGSFSFSSLAELSNMKVFNLSSKSSMLQVEAENSLHPTFQLRVIALPYCNLREIPSFLQYQRNLRLVDLSHNMLGGMFPSWLLENNPKLEVLVLENNSFTSLQLPNVTHNLLHLEISKNKLSSMLPKNIGQILPKLIYMNISMNALQGDLPHSMGEMKDLELLDLSHNNLTGEIPRDLTTGCYSLEFLRVSHNNFHGQIFPTPTNLTNLVFLFLANNSFIGRIGDGLFSLPYLEILDISNNLLRGTIPTQLANITHIRILSLAKNHLEGAIPEKLLNHREIFFLDLSQNMLSGPVPSRTFWTFPAQVYLHHNELTGSIPDTLLQGTRILDLRNNKLSGNIPEFISGQLIGVLLLRGNNLTGHIPHNLCGLRNIAILDLSNNRLNGSIPSCLSTVSFRGEGGDEGYASWSKGSYATDDLGDYYASTLVHERFSLYYWMLYTVAEIVFASKHRYDTYRGDGIGYMTGLDLSSNELTGKIPAELGDLQGVRGLNLSHNHLSGVIPASFSNLKDIESLDLSFNRLHGDIPQQLTNLHSVAVFNVSYNNLSGAVPVGGQFNTFDGSSYYGNSDLRVSPDNKSSVPTEVHDEEVKSDEGAIDMVWFYWSFAASYVTILLGIFTFLCINSPWRQAWFRFIDAFIDSVKNLLS